MVREEDDFWIKYKEGKDNKEKERKSARESETEERNRESEEQRIARKETWKDRTEEWLCDAAMRGDVESLKEIMKIDYYILDKVLVGSFKGKNPLHIATSAGQKEFVQELLEYKLDLAKAVDKELGTALHIASSEGYLEIVKLFVRVSPEMCMARDREGNNPLHIAAMKGKVEVLKLLLQTNPYAARLTVDRGDNILHLCVKYNQLASLVLLLQKIEDEEFVKCTDINGNNILHLAVFCKRYEIIKCLLEWQTEEEEEHTCCNVILLVASICILRAFGYQKEREIGQLIDVNARNGSGWTALDIYSRVAQSEREQDYDSCESEDSERLLYESGLKRSDRLFFPFDPHWQKKKKDTLMIVSSLMATMSFQVGINPPGGVWQDTSAGHEAGKAISAYTNPKAYPYLMYINTVGFLLSLTTILELIVVLPARKRAFGFIRAGFSWLTIMIIAFAYTFSVIVVSPTEMFKSMTNIVIFVTVIVWAVGVTFLRVLPFQFQLILLRVLFTICWVLCLPFALIGSGIRWVVQKDRTQPTESTVQSTGHMA